MKNSILISVLCGFIELSCSGQNEKLFDTFIHKFKKGELPFLINSRSFKDFGEYVWDGNVRRKNDFIEIDSLELNFLNEKQEKIPSYLYKRCVAIYSFPMSHSLKLVLYKVELNAYDDEEHGKDTYQIYVLATFDDDNKLIDKLKIAGTIAFKSEQYCIIEKNLDIKSQKFEFLPDDKDPGISAIESNILYHLSSEGRFIKIETKSLKGKYKTVIGKEGYFPN